jgi:hypothetical protein
MFQPLGGLPGNDGIVLNNQDLFFSHNVSGVYAGILVISTWSLHIPFA